MPSYVSDELMTEDILIRIPPTMREWLESTARRQRRSMNAIIRDLVEQAMSGTHRFDIYKEHRDASPS